MRLAGKLATVLSVAAAAGLSAAPGAGAAAADGKVVTCQFSDAIGFANPGVPSIADDVGAGEPVFPLMAHDPSDVESGTYVIGYSGGHNGTCTEARVSGGSVTPVLPPVSTTPANTNMVSPGAWAFDVCGSGFVDSDPGQTSFDFDGGTYSIDYRVSMSGGHGVLFLAAASDPDGVIAVDGRGYFSMVPRVGNCVTQNVTLADVKLGFTLRFPPPPAG